MMPLSRCFLFLALWLSAIAARAQPGCALPNPPDCGGFPFQAYLSDPSAPGGLGAEVQAFCVGQPVTFAPCASRVTRIDNDAFYGVLTGTGTTFLPSCKPPGQTSVKAPFTFRYVYTPQAGDVGPVTVSELTNENVVAKYYIRTFRVHATAPPVFTVLPCPSGALVTVTDATYDSYTAQAAGGMAVAVLRNRQQAVTGPAGAAVTVTGRYDDPLVTCTNSATKTPAALAAPQMPLFTRLTLQAPLPGAATLDVGQLPTGYKYAVQMDDGAGGFRDVADVQPGSSSVPLTIPTAGCYRLTRTDVCGGSPAATLLICTLSLAGASAQNRNQLLFTDAGAGTGNSYAVTRDGRPMASLTRTTDGFEDADVQCGTSYTYRVTATQLDGRQAVSNAVRIRTQSALPPPRPRLLASFNLNNVVVLTPILTTPLVAGGRLRYRRAAGPQPPTEFGPDDATGRGIRDSTALAELRANPPCYSVRLTDVCGNDSPESAATCPALLTATALNADGSTAALAWSAFVGPDAGIPATYVLQRLGPDGAVLSTEPASGGQFTDLLPPTDRQVLRYRLQMSGAGLPVGTFSYSNLATVVRQPRLTIPTAFTPNGDGLNDVLEVKGRYLRNYTFVVVDRNGQEVFLGTQRAEAWDGTIRGHAPVPSAYVWRFEQTNEDGTFFNATGAVTLLK